MQTRKGLHEGELALDRTAYSPSLSFPSDNGGSKDATSLGFHHPHVSCPYGVTTKILDERAGFIQRRFDNPPLDGLGFILVGLGKRGEHCGEIFASYICTVEDCLKVHYSKQSCGEKLCPKCYGIWLEEERDRIIARILSERAVKRNYGRRLVEITVSPDQKKLPKSRGEFDLLIRDGYKYIKKKGVEGGCVVIHPFRATKKAKKESWKTNEKTWKWIRRQKNPSRFYYYSPHLHVLAYVDHLIPPKKGERWIYKTNVNEKGKVVDFFRKAKREEVLRKMIGYFLSHTGGLEKEEKRFSSVRWFGTCSYNKFETTIEEREKRERNGKEKELKCKRCGSPLMEFWRWVREGGYRQLMMEYGMDVVVPPRVEEIMRVVEGKDPPEDAGEYLV